MTRAQSWKRRSWLVGLLVSQLAMPGVARAEGASASAAEHFDAGLKLYQRGRVRDAAIEFLTAFRLAPHPDALFNAGLALDAGGDSASAATAFAWAIEQGLSGQPAAEATARSKRLVKGLGVLRVTAPESSVVELSPLRRKGPSVVYYVLPGDSLVTVTYADGTVAARRVRVERGGEVLVDFTRSEEPGAPAPEAAPREPDTVPARSSPWHTVGYVALGVGALAGGAAYGFRRATLAARDDYVASGNTDADARDRALSMNRWTNVALVSAIASGAAGGALLLFVPASRSEVDVGFGPGGVAVSGRF